MNEYKCPNCNAESSAYDWNRATLDFYGDGIFMVEDPKREDANYRCPACGDGIDGVAITEVPAFSSRSLDVKIRKLHLDATVPTYTTTGAAAFDLVAVEDVVIAPGATAKIPLGLAFEIPPGYVMYVCMRPGIALKTKLRQPNGIGVIDSDYRGEVAMLFENTASTSDAMRLYRGLSIDGSPAHSTVPIDRNTYIVRKGDRVAQALIQPVPRVEFTVVDELSETDRGARGFGSTGVIRA